LNDDNQNHDHGQEKTKDDEMVTVWYDDLVDESTEHRYPYTATVTEECVGWVPPEYDDNKPTMREWFVREGARLVGGALPTDVFPAGTFDPSRSSEGRRHGDVVYIGFARRERTPAFHPRVTDAPDGLVVVAETTVATVPVISDDPTEVGR
jgi:hypothetical protein